MRASPHERPPVATPNTGWRRPVFAAFCGMLLLAFANAALAQQPMPMVSPMKPVNAVADSVPVPSIEDPVAPAEIVPLASSGGGGGGGCVLNSATQHDPILMLLMLAALIRVSWRPAALRVAAL